MIGEQKANISDLRFTDRKPDFYRLIIDVDLRDVEMCIRDRARSTPDRLILPHPRLQDRAFVLVPLSDVAPDWVHPRLGLTVGQMLAALPDADREAVRPL